MQHRLAARRALPRLHAHLTVLLRYRETHCHARDIPHLLRILGSIRSRTTRHASFCLAPRLALLFVYVRIRCGSSNRGLIRQCACPKLVAETPSSLHFPITSSHPARVWSTLPPGAPSVLNNHASRICALQHQDIRYIIAALARHLMIPTQTHVTCNRSNVAISTYSENLHHVMPGRRRRARAEFSHHATCGP
jgi:hypothetical protein